MIKVYPGEPDLDRIIRFHPPVLQRSHCPEIGVFVQQVVKNGEKITNHHLIGAKVNLAGDPIFKGDNGIVAEDGKEPIVPFILEITKNRLHISRTCPHESLYTDFPFKGLQAKEFNADPQFIREATGVLEPTEYFADRARLLSEDLTSTLNPLDYEIIKRRVSFLNSKNAYAFFDAYMSYQVELSSVAEIKDPTGELDQAIDPKISWTVYLKFCAWDPDALTGYVTGKLDVL